MARKTHHFRVPAPFSLFKMFPVFQARSCICFTFIKWNNFYVYFASVNPFFNLWKSAAILTTPSSDICVIFRRIFVGSRCKSCGCAGTETLDEYEMVETGKFFCNFPSVVESRIGTTLGGEGYSNVIPFKN